MEAEPSPEALEEIQAALARREKIMAVKLYREATGLSLAESKAAVDAMEAGIAYKSPPPSQPLKHAPVAAGNFNAMGCMFIIVAVTVLLLSIKMLMVIGQDDSTEFRRYSEAFSIALLVMITLQASTMAQSPNRGKLAFFALGAALLLMFGRIAIALDS